MCGGLSPHQKTPQFCQKVTVYTAGWARIGNTTDWKELIHRKRKLYTNRDWVQLFSEKALGAIPFIGVCDIVLFVSWPI